MQTQIIKRANAITLVVCADSVPRGLLASKDKDAFGVKQDHEVFFIPAFSSDDDGGQSQQITQGTLAGKLPANTFESSHCVVQTWGVKWGALGLAPVRPLVLFKQSCDLPAGKALSLM